MLTRLISIIFFHYCFSIPLISFAQLPVSNTGFPLHMRALTVEEGLPQGVINCLLQDKKGFVWLGTYAGLCRYDGKEVKVFRHDVANASSLAQNDISSMSLDSNNNIWIFFFNHEVDVFNTLTEQTRHIMTEPSFDFLRTIGEHHGSLRQIDSKFWGVTKERLLSFDPVSGKQDSVILPQGEVILSMGADRKGILWLATQGALYHVIKQQLLKVCPLPGSVSIESKDWRSVLNQPVDFIIEDQNHNLVIPSHGGMFTFNRTTHFARYISLSYEEISIPHIAKSKNGSIYFRWRQGIYKLDSEGNTLPVWTKGKVLSYTSFMIDDSDTWWWILDGIGVHLINLLTPEFRSYPYRFGFNHDPFVPFFNFNQSYQYSNDDAYFIRCAKDTSGNAWLRIAHNYTIRNGRGIGGRGIFKLNGKGVERVNFSASYKYFDLQITFSSDNDCWMLVAKDNSEMKLVRADFSTMTLIDVIDLKTKDKDNLNYFLSVEGANAFFSDGHELQVFDMASKRSVYYSNKKISNGTAILMTAPDKRNKDLLWIATYGAGIVKLHISSGKIEQLTEKDGLPDNTVYYIALDKRGYLWCSSNKGIFRLDPRNNSLVSFTAKDGLQGNEFNRYHFFETPDGHFIFGGTAGYTIFHPDSIYIDNYQTPSEITGIKLNNTALGDFPAWKDTSISQMQSLEVAHDQNFVTIRFAGLQYNNPDKLKYRYTLEGFDKSWVETGNLPSATYTNIPPGQYTFMVNSSNTSGTWSSKVKTLVITVLPPWWKTRWAYSFYFIISGSIIFALYRNWRQRALIKQEIILREKEAAQLKEIDEMKSRFFSNITHEFRTPLSLIISPLEDLKSHPEIPLPVRKKLSGIQRNAQQLARLINQLLDLSKLEAGSMKTSLSRGELNLFVDDCVRSFKLLAEAKHVQLNYSADDVSGEYVFDSDKCEKIIFNLLSNAIKFTTEGGVVNMILKVVQSGEAKHSMLLEVADTGIGIPSDKISKIFNRFFQVNDSPTRNYEGTGIGLSLTKELTELMGGTIQVESILGQGSTFHVSVPLQEPSDQNIPLWKGHNFAQQTPASKLPGKVNGKFITDSQQSLILLVEDNVELSAFIGEALESNYRVLYSGDGVSGLRIAQKELPDIIISDVMMPEMDGYDLCRHIKNGTATSHISFIILSARASHDSVIQGLSNNADEYITKPFYIDELLLRIRNIFEHQNKLRLHYRLQLTNPKETIDTNKEPNQLLKQVYMVIEEHIDDNLFSVEKLATKIAVSHRTLNRKLSVLVGLSAIEVIRQYRLKKAAELLRAGQQVSEVAYSVGFDTASYFSVSFKAFYGMTPSEYAGSMK